MPPPRRRPDTAPAQFAARAREALAGMADEFEALFQQELARTVDAREAWRAGEPHGLAIAAHDLKGLAATFGAPLVGRMAASLEKLLSAGGAPAALVEIHVDAMLAVGRRETARSSDGCGTDLALALEDATAGAIGRRLRQAA